MSKLRQIIFPVALLVAGCMSTPNELVSKDPVRVLESDKDSEFVAQCIVDAWDNMRGTVASRRMIGSTIRVMAHIGSSQLGFMAEVDPRGAKSITRYYEGVPVVGPSAWLSAIKPCI